MINIQNKESSNSSFTFYCALFICKEQTYYLKNENLMELSFSDNSFSSFYSSTKRLFLSYFENNYIEIISHIEGIVNPEKKREIRREVTDIYLPFISLSSSGESNLSFATLKNKNLNDITCNDIHEFYYFCKSRNLPPKVLKNTLALLNQMIKYFQNLGIIDRTCNFQVRRLSDKTNFTLDRIIMEA
jgi:hypothetical protein